MSVSDEFSDHNWQRLVEAGPQIALAVAASSGSGKQSVTELGAFLRLVDETADTGGGDDLLGRLASDTRDKLAAGMLSGNVDDAIPTGIQAAREAGAILAVHSSEEEARILRQWLLQVAHTVAAAAREGGLLGIGGQDLSDRERDTMAEIADGLGATPRRAGPGAARTRRRPRSCPPAPRRHRAKPGRTASRLARTTSARVVCAA